MQLHVVGVAWLVIDYSDSAFSKIILVDLWSCCAYTESETAGGKPEFHYEVHHVVHKFGHRTPASVKLQEVSRHAANGSDNDDDEDNDDETDNNLIPADTGHVISDDDTAQFEPIDTPVRSQRPIADGNATSYWLHCCAF